MKNRWIVALLPLLVLSLSGWLWNEKKEEASAMVGIWRSINVPQSAMLSFNGNGIFTIGLDNMNKVEITGDYRVMGDQIIFDADQTLADADCRERAYYYFKVAGEKMRLTLVADSCSSRRNLLAGHWELVSSPSKDKKKKNKINSEKNK